MNAVCLKISAIIFLSSFSWTLSAAPPKLLKPTHRQVAQLTKKEKAFVKKAKVTSQKAAKEPPPTVHMMDKMQSGVPQ